MTLLHANHDKLFGVPAAPAGNNRCRAETIPLGNLKIDPRKAVVIGPDGIAVSLTALNTCWGIDYFGTTRTLDQHILVLRRKLGNEAVNLVSVRSLGYKFCVK